MLYTQAIEILKEVLVTYNPKAYPNYFEVEPLVLQKIKYEKINAKQYYINYSKNIEPINLTTFTMICASRIGQFSMYGINVNWRFSFYDFLSDVELQESEFERFITKRFTEEEIVKLVEDIQNENFKSKLVEKFFEVYFLRKRPMPYVHYPKLFWAYKKLVNRT